jgi:hypothetical protein
MTIAISLVAIAMLKQKEYENENENLCPRPPDYCSQSHLTLNDENFIISHFVFVIRKG